MKLGQILDKVRGALDSPIGTAIKMFVPGVAQVDNVLDAVSEATGQRFDESSATREVVSAVDTLPPSERAAALERQVDLAIAESDNYAKVAIAQEQSNSSTRPSIALAQSAFVIRIGYLSFALLAVALIGDAVLVFTSNEPYLAETVLNGLPWFVGVFVAQAFGVIQQYFARRSDDKRTAMAGHGIQAPGGSGLLGQVGSLFKRS